jgi:hypothetical protein
MDATYWRRSSTESNSSTPASRYRAWMPFLSPTLSWGRTDDTRGDLKPGPRFRPPRLNPEFPIYLPQIAPLYTREPPSARNSVRRTIVPLQRPSPQPTLTWKRPEPLLLGHFSGTAPHVCPFFASLSLHSAARPSMLLGRSAAADAGPVNSSRPIAWRLTHRATCSWGRRWTVGECKSSRLRSDSWC